MPEPRLRTLARLPFAELLSAVSFAWLLLCPVGATAQSLAEVARQEEARRREIKQPSKVYTNDDLRGQPQSPALPPSAGPGMKPDPGTPTPGSLAGAGGSSGRTPQSTEATPSAKRQDSPAKDEKYWRDRMAAARHGLDRDTTYVEALQSRVNALWTDFVSRDDPIQKGQLARDRVKALGELERLKQQIATGTKAIADLEEEARRAGVPPGWLREK